MEFKIPNSLTSTSEKSQKNIVLSKELKEPQQNFKQLELFVVDDIKTQREVTLEKELQHQKQENYFLKQELRGARQLLQSGTPVTSIHLVWIF